MFSFDQSPDMCSDPRHPKIGIHILTMLTAMELPFIGRLTAYLRKSAHPKTPIHTSYHLWWKSWRLHLSVIPEVCFIHFPTENVLKKPGIHFGYRYLRSQIPMDLWLLPQCFDTSTTEKSCVWANRKQDNSFQGE